MVAWDQAKGKQSSGSNQRREIERLTLGVGDTKVRLVGDVMPRYCYWVVTKEGKKMPIECLQFNRETESFDNSAQDPFKEIDEAIYSDKPQFSYVCNVIDRADGKIKLFDLRATIYSQIVDYATNPDYGNPADGGNGYDITIKKEKTISTNMDSLIQKILMGDVSDNIPACIMKKKLMNIMKIKLIKILIKLKNALNHQTKYSLIINYQKNF